MAQHGGTARRLWDSRMALAIGFGGLLTLVAASGIDALRVLGRVRREDSRIRQQFLLGNHLLNDIRSQLYLSGTYVRDYLLDPEAARAEAYRASLEEVRRQMEGALASYAGVMQSEDAVPYFALKAELSIYWNVIGPILNWDAAQRRRRGYLFLRDDVFPRRAAMLEIAGRIAEINEQQLKAGNESVGALLDRFQYRLLTTLLATLVLGLGMALLSTRKILRLAAHAQERYEEVASARQQLANLSAKLVDAQESERRALSRDLHDEVGQSLAAVLVELRNLLAMLASGAAGRPQPQTQQQVELIKGLVEAAMRVVRNMALLLRPSMLDDLGLIPALKWQAREISKRTTMDVSVTTSLAADDFPDDYKTCIYRVVQEALNNCARHSHASTVRVSVRQQPGRLLLSVQDDGVGFDTEQTKGLGLLGMEERVAQLGGSCLVRSDPGTGTEVCIELPFAGREEQGSLFNREADSHSLSGRP
jgi:signal transduction histidine kinase